MKFDIHTHHDRCGHAEGKIRDYVEAAISGGLSVIGISDHSPFFGSKEDQLKPHIAMAKSEFSNYINEVLSLKKEFEGEIDVLLGVESDYFPEYAEVYRKIYSNIPFDYIIGSVHFTGGASIFKKGRFEGLNEKQKVDVKEEYYRLIMESAKSNMFHILGHIDAMRGFYPDFSKIQTPKVDETLKVIGECGVAIEVNTSAKNKNAGGWYPDFDILERARYFGVEISFGSDAHIPGRVGDDWELVAAHLKEIGYKEWVYYKQKQKQVVSL